MRPTPLLPVLALFLPLIAAAKPEVIISLQERHLYVIDQDEIIAKYPVGVGKPRTPTPPGTYRVTSVTAKPTWTVPESIMRGPHPPRAKRIPPGKGNPLGAYFLRLNGSAYGIHGTIAPQLLPGAVSAGCVRMRNQDVSALAKLVAIGTDVTILTERYSEPEPEEATPKSPLIYSTEEPPLPPN